MMAVVRNKYGAKWNRRANVSMIPTRTAMNLMVRDVVNTRLQYKPIEYRRHRKMDIDLIM